MGMMPWMGMMRHMGMMGGMGMMRPGMMGGMGGFAPWRRFTNSEERVARLEAYLKQLQAEEKGVQERIDELKKSGQSPRS